MKVLPMIRPMRTCFPDLRVVTLLTVTVISVASLVNGQGLILKDVSLRYGLERAWFTQTLCNKENLVRDISLDDTTLLVQGQGGTLEAIDGETGKKLWDASNRLHGSAFTLPGSCRRMIAVISGTNLFVLNRENGRLLLEMPMTGAGTTAPTISNFRIMVPLMDGRMATWPIIPDEEWISRMEEEKLALPENVAKINAEKWKNLRLDPKTPGMADHMFSLGMVENPVYTTLRLPSREYYAWTSDTGTFFVAHLQTFRSGLQVVPLFQATLSTPTRRQLAYIPPKGWPEDRETAMKLVERQTAAGKAKPSTDAGGDASGTTPAEDETEDLFAEDAPEIVEEPADGSVEEDLFGMEESTEEEPVTDSTEETTDVAGGEEASTVTMKYSPDGIPELSLDGDLGAVVLVDERGQIFAFDQRTGRVRWRGSIRGRPLSDPVVISRKVFVHSTLGGTFCFDGDTGEMIWNVQEPLRFLAASKTRFYGEDKLGKIAILSLSDGSPVDRFPTGLLHRKLVNTQSDRLYVTTDDGLIQCFHEVGIDQPILRTLPDPDPQLDEDYIAGLRRRDRQGKAATASTVEADTGFDPFAEVSVDEEEEENPFDTEELDPFADGGDEDPFA
ncbi:MAG: PQQ-binding-like beta-propeller repeat protein, partial [Planctomycetia bacterium]|nr:PQQ-binding-like beta-propeller repeat protein [Planctomycetia bacterium]